jgi:hypothetical protein
MRDYGKVHSTFWSSPTTGALSDEGKLLALYLMTCGHGTIAGVFRLPDGYISEDLGEAWPQGPRCCRVFEELAAAGWARQLLHKPKWVVDRQAPGVEQAGEPQPADRPPARSH